MSQELHYCTAVLEKHRQQSPHLCIGLTKLPGREAPHSQKGQLSTPPPSSLSSSALPPTSPFDHFVKKGHYQANWGVVLNCPGSEKGKQRLKAMGEATLARAAWPREQQPSAHILWDQALLWSPVMARWAPFVCRASSSSSDWIKLTSHAGCSELIIQERFLVNLKKSDGKQLLFPWNPLKWHYNQITRHRWRNEEKLKNKCGLCIHYLTRQWTQEPTITILEKLL